MRWADDFDEIRKNIGRIKEEELPRCPQAHTRLLRDCLRMEQKCSETCPHRADWVGPNG
jgi:hypothetical protein